VIASTSVKARAEHRAEGRTANQLTAVMRLLRGISPTALTRNQISRTLNIPIQSVCARVYELRADGKVVDTTETRRDHQTGRSGRAVRAASDLFEQ
jgi:predicted Rossmann fold nucleotide-binding protein DprA/Smf involved in DNA uptake